MSLVNQLSEHDFESYYPDYFKDEVDSVLNIKDKDKKRKAKKDLLLKVKDWIELDKNLAKMEFEKSASEVIDFLKNLLEKLG